MSTMDWFKGKTIFVTGGGSGINFGIARNFAKLGANIAICSRSQDKLNAAAAELRTQGGQVLPVAADVRNADEIKLALDRSSSELGPADVVVCGAAGNFLCAADKLSPNGFKTVIEIDLVVRSRPRDPHSISSSKRKDPFFSFQLVRPFFLTSPCRRC